MTDRFNLQAYLEPVYSGFPESNERPVVGISANFVDGDLTLRDRYYKQVERAGGVPVVIPPSADSDVIINTLNRIDALLLTGGGDFNPLWQGEQPQPELHTINSERDLPELLLTRLAFNRQIPMLGICRGIQTLAIALDGKVSQNITSDIKHSQDADRSEPTHVVEIEAGSMLHDIYEVSRMYVNSFHHQAVSATGSRFRVVAKSPDGIVEAMESSEHKSILGVQWHPEWLGDDGLKLFQWLVERGREFAHAKRLHARIITLDTHCDTPMFFPEGVDFASRDPRILVDLHKMTEGRLDATTMVAYLEQPKDGKTFAEIAPFAVSGPRDYADLIFDKIGDIIAANAPYIAQARNQHDLEANKLAGKKSIMLGIENGLALEGDPENVSHFASRGVVYITLCHNGDNDICDSARGNVTHGGVSELGERIIHEMNRQGVMVDLSHASEQSFFDALEISQTPIVCSHSNCKALCDVPRNLTDEQLRKLASKGGVAHTTLYLGFLRREGEASIIDAIDHLEHAIKVMGIDHVGLGTDFDGDGGVSGLADSSELINFTIQLLRRHYSDEDIQKIWGGNWLRVMNYVQSKKQ